MAEVINLPKSRDDLMKKYARYLIFIGLLLTPGCSATSNFFLYPASPIAAQESRLYWQILIMSAFVFVVVEGLLLYNIIRFRKKPSQQGEPPQIYRAHLIEAIYTAVPILLVIVIFFLMLRTMQAVAAPAPQAGDLNLRVVGHRWWWEFDYPDLNIVTANELHIPVNTTVQIDLESMDVIHSFYVPQLSGKTDVIPGMTNHMWLRGDRVGKFHGQCSEYCGENHANMRITVFVDSPADFQAWVANQQQPPTAPQTEQQKQAETLITEGMCSMCHNLGDSGPGNATGPNLTHLMSRTTFAGGIFELNEENLHRWLEDTQAMKPGNDMDHKFSEKQIDALMSYLLTLK